MILRILPLLFILLTLSSITGAQQTGYVKKYKSLAQKLAKKYEIPYSLILGVAIVESSSGKGRTCRLLNNHFGIKGKNNLYRTRRIKTAYKQYPNAKSSFEDFCLLVTRRKFYPALKGNPDPAIWIDKLSKTGYSERPEEWKRRITLVIEANRLN
jgi:flagellum-specific peptidoglycan hydrolase FlgJ